MIRTILLATIIHLLVIGDLSAQVVNSIPTGTPVLSFSGAATTVADGIKFAVPGQRGIIITWQTSFLVAPASITVNLQGSLDNISYFTLDTSTVVGGAIRYLGPTSPKFVRCSISASSGGSGFTCSINIHTFNNTTLASGGTLTTPLSFADGTSAAPSGRFTTSPTWGFYRSPTMGFAFTVAGPVFALDSAGPALGSSNSIRWLTTAIDGGSAFDLRLRRSATKTLTLDDGAAGATTLAVIGKVNLSSFLFANIATVLTTNGDMAYCSDCTIANPCAGAGTGAFAKRINGVNVCN